MRKISQEEFEKRIFEKHGNKLKVLGKYINKRTKILIQCNKCNYKWEANPEPLWNGHGCPKCAGNIKRTTELFKKEVFEIVGEEYTVLGEYKDTHFPILMKHNVCGNEFRMSPKAFLYNGQRCPNERYKKSAKSNSSSFDEVKKKVDELGRGEYEIIGRYICSSKKVEFLHKCCGHTFKLQPTRFINEGIRCSYCYRSKGEEAIREYLKSNNVDFKEQYRIRECKNIRPLPFDFALFENGSLKCLIEYDGSQHYNKKFGSSDKEFLRIKNNDKIKNEYFKNNNILLIRIKYVSNYNPNTFKENVIKKLKNEFAKYNMTIPNQA